MGRQGGRMTSWPFLNPVRPALLVKAAVAVTILSLASFSLAAGRTDSLKTRSIAVAAPFEMPPIISPDFTGCRELAITDFGAKTGDKRATTQALANAIRQASESGGGVVVVPAGEWLTGAIHLLSNVNLRLDEGSVLLFSEDPADYLPPVKTTWEGMECYNYSPLVYAYGCRNIAITGKGKLKAKLDVWRKWYARPPAHLEGLKKLYNLAANGVPVEERQMVGDEANLRPHFLQFNRCENVLLEGVSIEDSPFWVIHPYLSKNVVIRGVKVNAHGHNNDGVDPDMSQNVLIEDCDFDQGDDAIAVKSGSNQDAWRLNTPSKNVVVRNCLVRNAHQLLAIGSEVSGGIENVAIENCRLDESIKDVGHLLFIKTNERRGGYVKNIYMRNITAGAVKFGVLGIETDVLYQWRDLVPTYEKRLTPIGSIHVQNVSVTEAKFITRIQGVDSLPVQEVELSEVKVGKVLQADFLNKNVEGFKFTPGSAR